MKRAEYARRASNGERFRLNRGGTPFADLIPFAPDAALPELGTIESTTSPNDEQVKAALVAHLTVRDVRRAVSLLDAVNRVDAMLKFFESTDEHIE
jgi:antitoxin (DNA-binding transcriptional repressor) of toxin-antitoxin stability system